MMAQLLADPTSRLVIQSAGTALMARTHVKDNGSTSLTLVTLGLGAAQEAGHLAEGEPVAFLGLDSAGNAAFTGQLGGTDDDRDAREAALAASTGADWHSIRKEVGNLEADAAPAAALASGIVEWHKRNRFCAVSGERLVPVDGGWALYSPATRKSVYPRIDPAVIMLVTCGDFVLLGANKRWEQGRYSALAGFVQLGETFERTVGREVLEESGVTVDPTSITYMETQPWPFPQSLMVGFTAAAAAPPSPDGVLGPAQLSKQARAAVIDSKISKTELNRCLGGQDRANLNLPGLTCQATELADVRWFHRLWLTDALSGADVPQLKARSSPGPLAGQLQGFNIPGPYSLANRMLNAWLEAGSQPAWRGDEVAKCEISEGRFKYILIRVSDGTGSTKVVVRGHEGAAYHNDVFMKFKEGAQDLDLNLEPLGGGRIDHDATAGTVHVYGHSMAYGPAVHEVAASIIRAAYPEYSAADVTCTYEGY